MLVHKDPLFRAEALRAFESKELGISRGTLLPKLIALLKNNTQVYRELPSPQSSSHTMMDEIEILVRKVLGSRPSAGDRHERIVQYNAKMSELAPVFLAEGVNRAIARGVTWLKELQAPDGSWHYCTQTKRLMCQSDKCYGATALTVYALLESGMDLGDEPIRRGLNLLLKGMDQGEKRPGYSQGIRSVYTVSTTCMAFSAALHGMKERKSTTGKWKSVLRSNLHMAARRLIASQSSGGAWSYGTISPGTTSDPRFRERLTGRYDYSNTQFALLGLASAQGAGISVPRKTWERILAHLRENRNRDGGWGYTGRSNTKESMTSAGVGGMILARQAIEPEIKGKDLREDRDIAAGLGWMTQRYHMSGPNRSNKARMPRGGWGFFYNAYSLERAMMLSETQLLGGKHDWYHDGATSLLRGQSEDGSWGNPVDTTFALLFLKRSFVTGR